MQLLLNIPDRCEFVALYSRRNGWAAQVRADSSWKTPSGGSHFGLSGSSDGEETPQSAIDLAYEKMGLTIERLNAEPRRPMVGMKTEPKPLDPSAIAGLDLGGLDL